MKQFYNLFAGLMTLLIVSVSSLSFGQGATCATADPFCTSTVYAFPNQTNNGSAPACGNDYDCLSTTPNPVWYYMEIGTSGNLVFDITQTNGSGSGIDVDFILYGPFTNLANAQANCCNLGNGSSANNTVIDCSYSTAAQETATITGAVAGEVYMMLITNFSNEAGTITFQQTGGAGSTDCSIVQPPCPTVGIHAEDASQNQYPFPITLDCDAVGWLTIREDDIATAGGIIAPAVVVDIQPTNANAAGNHIYGWENNLPGPTWNNYWGLNNAPANSNYTFTMLEVDNGPGTTQIGVELCSQLAGANMPYTITDAACGGVITTGTWIAGGDPAGPGGPSGGCQFITIPVGSVGGTAVYTCPTCPPGSFVTTDYGRAFFNPSIAGPGSYDVQYCFDNGCPVPDNCQGCVIETIVVNNVNTAASLSYTTPVCSNSGNISPTLTGTTGGTYSSTAGLSINAGTGVINVGASTPGTYTVTYFVGTPLPSTCNATVNTSVTITALPVGTFSYTGSPYCQNAANPSPTFSGGGVAGTFTSAPAGLSINAGTGVVNLGASTPGTYTVTNTIAAAGGCPAVVENTTITITALPVGTFSYTGSPYCQNAADPSPTFSGGGVAGTFTSAPGGLSINAGTGVVDVSASSPGTYTVTNTIAAAGGCPAIVENTTITITALPVGTFSYTGSPYCQNAGTASPTFSGGVAGTFTSAPAGLSINAGTGVVNLGASTPGTYTVTNTIAAASGCPAVVENTTITITALPVGTFSYPASPYCQSGSDPSPTFSGGGVAGTFTSVPGGLSINAGTGVVDVSASSPGTYTVTNTIAAAGGCPAVIENTSITITAGAVGTFSYPASPYCQNASDPSPTFSGGGIAGTFTSAPGGLSINAGTGVVDVSASSPGTYTVTNTIAAAGGCPAVIENATITITALPIGTFSYPASPYCQNASDPSPTFSGGGVAGTFTSAPVGLSINSGTGVVDVSASTPGTYTVTNTIAAAGGCPAVIENTTITITALPVGTFSYTGSPYCQNASDPSPTFSGGGVAGTFTSAPVGLSINSSTGVVSLVGSTPGTYTVTNTIAAAGGCPAVVENTTITITAMPVGTFSYTGSPYCQNAANPSPTFSGGGVAGTFTASPAGLSINAVTGVVNLAASTPGTYTVTNTIAAAGGCPAVVENATITITALPIGTFSYTGSPYCQDAANPSPTFSGGGVAGTFTASPAGLSINAGTGVVNLAASTPGTYTVTNTIAAAGGCPAVVENTTITIDPRDDPNFSYASGTYCLTGTDPLPSVITTPGGTFTISAPGVINPTTGLIDLGSSGLGSFTVTYNTNSAGNPCPDLTTFPITITAAPSASFSYDGPTYCQDAVAPILTYGPGAGGGVFTTSPAGLNINSGTGAINLANSTPGLYTVYNTIAAAGGCAAALDSTTIEVFQMDSALFSYNPITYCESGVDPIANMGGNATLGGTFTITAPGVINAGDGTIDLSASGVGTFTVYYNTTIVGNPCPSMDSITITITPAPTASFTYDALTYCQDAAAPILTIGGGATSGVFTAAPFGLSINGGTGAVDLLTSTPGLYTVYNTIVAAGGCAMAIDSTTIEIFQVDSAQFGYSTLTHCITGTDPVVVPGANQTPGGIYTITAPGVINAGNGTVNLAGSGLGTFTVYYNTTVAGNPCPSMDSVVINIVNAPGATFTYNTPFCEGDTATVLPSFGGNDFAGVFSSNPAGVSFVSTLTGQIDLTTSTAGSYTIYNNLAASGGCSAAVDSFQIVINPIFTTPVNAAICQGDSILLGGIYQNTAGVYEDTLATTFGCDSIIQTTLSVNPVTTTPQSASICTGDSILLGGAYQTAAGVYEDTLTSALGCDSIIQTTLTVNTIILTPISESICQGDSILLGGAYQTAAGIYNDTLVALGGCDSVIVTTLTVNTLDTITPSLVTPICASDPLNLIASTTGTGSTITWYSDATGTTVVGTGSPLSLSNPGIGIHTYYVNSVGTCSSGMDSVIVVVGGVNAVINAAPVTGPIPLSVFFGNGSTTGAGVSYSWDFGDGNTSNQFEPTNIYTGIGTYTVTLIVTDGICSDTATIIIDAFGESAVLIPNVFTPNGDGSNDFFTVDGVNLESVEGQIFNRWGQLMFSWDNVKGSWDGRTLAGSEAPDGTYFYIISAKGFDGTEYFEKGGFSLIR